MLNEPTAEKLRTLRLDAMARVWEEQQRSSEVAGLSFDERFGLLVDAEWLHRENARFARYVKEARLRLSQACVEDIDYPARRELDRAQVRQLATCRWVHEHQNVLVSGATGTGKTYIACALAHQACRKGYRAAYRRASRLFEELRLARASGTYARLLGKLARLDILVIGDWALAPSPTSSVVTSTRSSKTATKSAPRSSRANCRRPSGTSTSAIRRSPTRSATACCTTRIASC